MTHSHLFLQPAVQHPLFINGTLTVWQKGKKGIPMHVFYHSIVSGVCAYVIVSFVEYFSHRFVMHRNKIARRLRNCYMEQSFLNHAVGHHHKYYRVFNHEDDPVGKYFNLTVELKTTAILLLPLGAVVFWIDPLSAAFLVVMALGHNVFFNAFHQEMHLATGNWLSTTWMFRRIQRTHYLHHEHPNKNFNVMLPLFDWVFGTAIHATAQEKQQMRELGI